MAEDQGVNGDRWTDQALKLLERLGWKHIADCNIDIEGADEKRHGIDSLLAYEDGYKPRQRQGVFLEAKRYKTTSFAISDLSNWILKFDSKINEIKKSEKFLSTYPLMENTLNHNGLIVIWFHDTKNYDEFKEKISVAMQSVKISNRGKGWMNRVFVLDNRVIYRLISLVAAIKEIEQENSQKLFFYYPSSVSGQTVVESDVLNLEYIFSDFIFAKGKSNSNIETDNVFYFGDLGLPSFYRLKSALITHNAINKNNQLNIFIYDENEEEFRKIRPDIETAFKEECLEVKMIFMTKIETIPGWMKN